MKTVSNAPRCRPATAREREVFELVAAGEPNKAIARQLGTSFRTVELHRAHVIEKLQARSLSDLIRMGIILNSLASGGLQPNHARQTLDTGAASRAKPI